jgi:hypothetical protein
VGGRTRTLDATLPPRGAPVAIVTIRFRSRPRITSSSAIPAKLQKSQQHQHEIFNISSTYPPQKPNSRTSHDHKKASHQEVFTS